MSTLLIQIAIYIVLICIIVFVSMTCRKLQAEKTKLEVELQAQKANLAFMVRHAEELAQIKKDQKTTDQKIAEAKTDEEIIDIINAVIASNNDRVRDDFPE